MTVILHPNDPRDEGEMKRYSVVLRTDDKRVKKVQRGDARYNVSVFACGMHGAIEAAKEKSHDKWFRHRGWRVMDWTVVEIKED
jgi:hypothetical protein